MTASKVFFTSLRTNPHSNLLDKMERLVRRAGIDTCSEHCPTQAVSMIPYRDGLTIPHTNPQICVGCGGCEYVCPATPHKAIYVEGEAVHQEALPFEDAGTHEVELDGFGF